MNRAVGLDLLSLDGDETVWASVEPGLMEIVTSVGDDVWTLDVTVRDEPHCSWTLERQ